MAGHARAAHAIGVADRDRAAVHVQQFVRDAELVLAIEHLHRESLVQLPQADIVHLKVVALEQFRDREDRADAHLVRLGAGNGHADIAAERGEAALLGHLLLHQHAGRRTVRQLRGIAGGDGAVRQHRLERGQALGGRLGAIALVLGERDLLLGDFLGLLVDDVHRRGDRHDLVVELARGLRGGGALLRLQGIGIATVAADAVAGGDHFGGLQHRHVDVAVHREQLAIGLDAHLRGLDQADRFEATANGDVHIVDDDLLGGSRDGHQARGALAVDRHAGDRDGQAGAQQRGAGDIAGGAALLERGAEHDVLHFRRIDAGALDRGLDRIGAERRRRRGVERAAIGAADAGTGGGDDDCGARHGLILLQAAGKRAAWVSSGRSNAPQMSATPW